MTGTASTVGSGATPPAGRRRRRRRVLIAAVAVVCLLAAWLGGGTNTPTTAAVGRGKAAPAFQLQNLIEGQPAVSLTGFIRTPVVLNFWASWCVPCRTELPAFASAADDLRDNVAFVGIDNTDSRDAAIDLATASHLNYPSGFDPSGKVASGYGLFGMPTTYFISADGKILGTHTGQLSSRTLRDTISRLFGV